MKRRNTREMGNKRHMTPLQISGRLCCSFIFWEEGWEENHFYPFLSLCDTVRPWCVVWKRCAGMEERFIRRSELFTGSRDAVNSHRIIYTRRRSPTSASYSCRRSAWLRYETLVLLMKNSHHGTTAHLDSMWGHRTAWQKDISQNKHT